MIKFQNVNENNVKGGLKLKSLLWETLDDGSIIKDDNNVNHQIIKLQPAEKTEISYVQILCFAELNKAAFINSEDAKKMNEVVNCVDCLGAKENNTEILNKILKRSERLYK